MGNGAQTGSVLARRDAVSKSEFAGWLRGRVEERDPTAVVRFGDGEARLLKAEPSDGESMDEARRKLAKETGRSFSVEEALEVKALVELAYDRADALGILYEEHFSAEAKRWMKTLADLYPRRLAAGGEPAICISCLPDWSDLHDLVSGRRISAISCRDVKGVLETHWEVRDVYVHQVPSQYLVRDVDGPYEAAMHESPIWPDAHDRVAAELKVRERGEVFLVGAGLFGKDLCIRVREEGGIALDIGSLLDFVAGKVTRGVHRRVFDQYAGGMSVAEIAAELQKAFDVPVDPREISDITDPLLEDAEAWNRERLEAAYVAVRSVPFPVTIGAEGAARTRACHLGLGVAEDGSCEALGVWWQDAEAKGRRPTLDDLRRRGVHEARFGDGDSSPEIEASLQSVRKAIERRGRFSSERDVTGLVHFVLSRTRHRW